MGTPFAALLARSFPVQLGNALEVPTHPSHLRPERSPALSAPGVPCAQSPPRFVLQSLVFVTCPFSPYLQ